MEVFLHEIYVYVVH